MATDDIMLEIQAAFRDEAADLLTDLESGLLSLEQTPGDKAIINSVFRAMHTIKGSGASVDFHRLAAFVHHFEDAMDMARKDQLPVTKKLIDLALQSMDRIKTLLDEGDTSPCSREEIAAGDPLLQQLSKLMHGDTQAGEAVPAVSAESTVDGRNVFDIVLHPCENPTRRGSDPVQLLNALQQLGDARFASVTRALSSQQTEGQLTWKIELWADCKMQDILQAHAGIGIESRIDVTKLSPEEDTVIPLGPYFVNDVLPDFEDEVDEILQHLDEEVTALEKSPEPARLEGLCSAIHGFHDRLEPLLGMAKAPPPRNNALAAMILVCRHVILRADSMLARKPEQLEPEWPAGMNAVLTALRLMSSAFLNEEDLPEFPADLLDWLGQDACGFMNMRDALREVVLKTAPVAVAKGAAKEEASRAEPATGAAGSMRVDENKFNAIMQSVGDLLIARKMLPSLIEQLQSGVDPRKVAQNLKDAYLNVDSIADRLQNSVMSVRLLPINMLFKRYPRMVRDLARNLEKDIRLDMQGEETEVDKTILEQLSDPFIHLVRNAVDHGIESPAEREAVGKPREGVITLSACNERGFTVLKVRDDGKGLDADMLKRKAIEKGILGEDEAARMRDEDAYKLIFAAGFSMAKAITDVSGRGVGMDVVQNNIKNMQGSIDIESTLGLGSTVIIRIPVKTILMVLQTILVRCGAEEYLLPMDQVVELDKIPVRELHQFRESYMATIRGRVYPIAYLSELLGVEIDADEQSQDPDQETLAVAIVRCAQKEYALIMDRFVSREQVVVKPLAGMIQCASIFSGMTIMGDGRIIPVINSVELLALMQELLEERKAALAHAI